MTETPTVEVVLKPLAVIRRLTDTLVDQAANGAVSIPAIRDAVLAEFLRNPGDVAAWLEETMTPVVYDTVQRRVANTRRGIVEFGDYVMPVAEVKAIAKAQSPKWLGWLEHSGNAHKRLMDMNRDELFVASEERAERGLVELRYATLWQKMGERLAPGQRVRDIFTPEDIESLASTIIVHAHADLVEPRPTPQLAPAPSPEENAAD